MHKCIDKILNKLGLVRKSYHQNIMEGNNRFLRKLGQAAKEAGIAVCFDDDMITGLTLDSDIYILGSNNIIRNCDIQGTIIAAPTCRLNAIIGCSHTGKQ